MRALREWQETCESRLEALEKAGAPAGPDAPSEPSGPLMPSPDPLGQPAPARPPDPVPALPGPVLPQPVAPAKQPLRDPSLPLAPGAGGAAAPVRVLVCGHSLVFWAFREAVDVLNRGLEAVIGWMWANKLKLNLDKMESQDVLPAKRSNDVTSHQHPN
ncbi:basic proline-rich protein-like isoform X4 [Hemicordylus capensis]|uniref:basic proline-rich protein-like isoform X4 n=1 Tax=Hemicordylus capensis TaxID=884348 RepID=UPI0023021411|nr:basic proline-rich protein-like isoform X4 [Hemicordylus capensis]